MYTYCHLYSVVSSNIYIFPQCRDMSRSGKFVCGAPWTLSALLLEVALCGASGIVMLLGSCGGGVSFTAGVVSKVCQRLCWGRWSSRHLGGCFLCVRRCYGPPELPPNIPRGATTPLGRSCRMGIPERGGGKKAVYCLN